MEPIYKATKAGKIQEWRIEVEGNKYRTISGQTDGQKVTSEWTVCAGKNIGRSNETTPEEQAKEYLLQGAIRNYDLLGYGFYLIELRSSQQAIGMCGFEKRDYLEVADLGFALLQKYEGSGYAFEAASACLTYAKQHLRLSRVQATTRLDNLRSSNLLEKLGMLFKSDFLHPDGDRYLKLYEIHL